MAARGPNVGHVWAKSFSGVSGLLHRDSQAMLTKKLGLDPKGLSLVIVVCTSMTMDSCRHHRHMDSFHCPVHLG